MANTVVLSRSHLIYGVCLPLAVLIGYLLAEPLESGSIAVLVLVLSILCVPVMMRWHHPLLIFSCNALVCLMFVPGRPTLGMIMASVSMLVLVLNRSIGRDVRFFRARQVSMAVLAVVAVTLITAYTTGGVGFAAFGASSNAGGKRYLSIVIGAFMYFGLSTIPISRKHAGLAVAVFFLSALTGLVGFLVALGGSNFYFLVEFFPIEGAVDEMSMVSGETATPGFWRLGELTGVAVGIFCFVLARYGVRGALNLSRPWRLVLLVLAVLGNLYSGFRSNMILCGLTFMLVFYFEGLFRTRYFFTLILIGLLGGALMMPYAQKLPFAVQRTLAFLPINIDPVVRQSAEASTGWRLEMWQEVLPTIPQYLIKGKGYVMDQNDLYLLEQAEKGGFAKGFEGSMLAGDYHSGPLSVIVPFGLPGVFAFFWFLYASLKALRQNYKFGDPALGQINVFLYTYFIARIIAFFFVVGSLYGDFALFAGLVGFSVSLNGGVCEEPANAVAVEAEPELA